ncbi:hypothetical protein F5Y18DRAFT_434686 [Xylariaceae sp. FL1019]|nr:hypothetical protein F5Y18DRAFT_434686 [Xylariaceae sp. FL1019]
MALSKIPIVFLFFLLTKYTLRFLRPRIGRLPGPAGGRLSSLYRIWLLSDGKGPSDYDKLHQKYGPIIQTGPNHVSISDASQIPVIYDSKNIFIKSEFYNIFRPMYRGRPMDTVFTTQDAAWNKKLKVTLVKSLTDCPSTFSDEIQ